LATPFRTRNIIASDEIYWEAWVRPRICKRQENVVYTHKHTMGVATNRQRVLYVAEAVLLKR